MGKLEARKVGREKEDEKSGGEKSWARKVDRESGAKESGTRKVG